MAKRDISQRYRDDWSPHPHVAFKRYATLNAAGQDLTDASEPGSGEPAKAFMVVRGTGDLVVDTAEQSDYTYENAEDILGTYMPVELKAIDAGTDDSLVVVAFW